MKAKGSGMSSIRAWIDDRGMSRTYRFDKDAGVIRFLEKSRWMGTTIRYQEGEYIVNEPGKEEARFCSQRAVINGYLRKSPGYAYTPV